MRFGVDGAEDFAEDLFGAGVFEPAFLRLSQHVIGVNVRRGDVRGLD